LGALQDRIELDPALVEQAVLLATDAATPEVRRSYRQERDRVYEIPAGDDRESRFRDLDASWFQTLRLEAPLSSLLREFEPVLGRVCRCLVLLASRRKDEGADLHENREGAPALALKLTPESLVRFDRVAPHLRSELLHVEDMLDPTFGYERGPLSDDVDPMYEKLVRDRYRVLWNASVNGRLDRRELLPKEVEARGRREFLAAFSMLGPDAEAHYRRLFEGPRPSHGDLLRFARAVEGRASGRCSLCRLPTAQLRDRPLEAAVGDEIRRDFPEWSPSRGICGQCADLYEARASAASGTSRGLEA
jgi:hypothetical protein